MATTYVYPIPMYRDKPLSKLVFSLKRRKQIIKFK